MDCSAPCPRLGRISSLGRQIMRIWRALCPIDQACIYEILGELPVLAELSIDWTLLRDAIGFWDPQHAVFNFQGTELTPTIEEYTALIERPPATQDIMVPNPFATISSRLSVLLGIRIEEAHQELIHGWKCNIRIDWLIDWTHVRALNAQGCTYQRDVCHGFLLLVFGTVLFPSASTLIDRALTHVVFQVVEGCSYVEALMAETVRSLDYVQANRHGMMMGSLQNLQMWLLTHIQSFCLHHPFLNLINDQLFQEFRISRPNAFDWSRFMQQLTPEQFSWSASWNPGGSMTVRCPAITRLPLISHYKCTLVFPDRVIKQLDGLQDVPVEGNRAPYQIAWTESAPSASERFLRIRVIRQLWDTRLM
ncbi:hypothetical protein CRG98_000747 [Punica granatum]|uniref:DUF7745 domain-containing protein n=1 Tax=Punica granatum TaxID=22663 RepID=A0A2I0LF96_PUNGR|nr:hypothetical protein CRG98_000747 [Punica granatum]